MQPTAGPPTSAPSDPTSGDPSPIEPEDNQAPSAPLTEPSTRVPQIDPALKSVQDQVLPQSATKDPQDSTSKGQNQGPIDSQAGPTKDDPLTPENKDMHQPTTIKLWGQPSPQQTIIRLEYQPKDKESTHGLGGMIYSALGAAGPLVDTSQKANLGSPDPSPSTTAPQSPVAPNAAVLNIPPLSTAILPSSDLTLPPQIVTAAGHLLTILNPSAVVVASTTLSINGPAATISGLHMSLASSVNLVIGANTETQAPSFIIARHIFTAGSDDKDPSHFTIADTTLSAGGPAATIPGTPISLAKGGNLVVGSAATAAPTQPHVPAGDQAFSPNPDDSLAGTIALTTSRIVASLSGTALSASPLTLNPNSELVSSRSSQSVARLLRQILQLPL